MIKITEKKGRSHVFTLKDGSTLRIFARKSVEVKEELISDEIKSAEKLGLVIIGKPNAPVSRKPQPPSTSNKTEVKS